MTISLSAKAIIRFFRLLKMGADTSEITQNNNMFGHFKVDGEVFRGPGEERCDYLLLNDEAATSYYIELKGSDLPKAIRQIENTIKLLSPSLPGYAVLRRIVYHTGSHNVHASEVLRWKARYKAVVKERAYSENI